MIETYDRISAASDQNEKKRSNEYWKEIDFLELNFE